MPSHVCTRAALLVLFLLSSSDICTAQSPVLYFNDLENPGRDDVMWMNLDTRMDEGGNRFSRTTPGHPYGLGLQGGIPIGAGSSTCKVSVDFDARTDYRNPGIKLVFMISKGDKKVYWNSIDLSGSLPVARKWITVTGCEQVIPAGYTDGSYSFACYLWNTDTIAAVDADNFKLKFTAYPAVSFVPVLPPTQKIADGYYATIYQGRRFSIQLDKVNGSIRLIDTNGGLLWDRISAFHKMAAPSADAVFYSFLLFDGDELSEEGRIFKFAFRNSPGASLKLIVPADGNLIRFQFSYKALQSEVVERVCLLFHAGIPEATVFNSRGEAIHPPLSAEYWLGNGGVTWESKSCQWTLYHPDHASSVQVDRLHDVCCVNADYAADHPLLYWPMESESRNHKTDRSSMSLHPGDSVYADFTVYSHDSSSVLPRIMPYPSGYEAAVLFTEHADFTSLRSQRVMAFGTDTSIGEWSTQGFVGRKIPVTKSIFYTNPDRVMNSEKAGFSEDEICSLTGTPGFKELLMALQKNGWEIALHTPEQFTGSRESVKQALREMQKDFKVVTWIDHGYDNGKKSNREDLVCDGFNSRSPYFIGDLLQQSGIRNFWNCFYEDSSFYGAVKFNDELVVPHPAFEPAYPQPVLWVRSDLTGDAVHFRTTSTLDPPDGTLWNYFLDENRLDFLIRHHGDFIAHVYPSRIDSTNGYYEWKEDVWRINPSFDEALARISKKSEEGRIWLPVVDAFTRHFRALDKISYSVDQSGSVVISNTSSSRIEGFSMVTTANDVVVTGKQIEKRKSNNELLFWFDIDAGETVVIKTVVMR